MKEPPLLNDAENNRAAATEGTMSDRLMRDVTKEYEKMRAELLLIRVVLGLRPIHDPVEAVRLLYEKGREEFERVRGEKCGDSASWLPR